MRQRIATSENVEPVTSTACAAPRRTPSSAAAATSRPTAPAKAPCVATTFAGSLFTNSSTTHCVASWPGLPIAVMMRMGSRSAPGRRRTSATALTYALALYDGATLDNLREALTTLEETARIARRVLGSAHPLVELIAKEVRATLCARGTPEKLAQDAFRTARAKLAQERAELAKTLAADAAPVEDAASGDVTSICEAVGAMTT